MARIAFATLVLGVVLGSDLAAAPQCVSFSKDIPCVSKSGAIDRIDFRVSKQAPDTPTTKPAVVRANDVEKHQQAIDCAMVKKVDPTFDSAMPVVKPDPTVRHSIREIPVPPCK